MKVLQKSWQEKLVQLFGHIKTIDTEKGIKN